MRFTLPKPFPHIAISVTALALSACMTVNADMSYEAYEAKRNKATATLDNTAPTKSSAATQSTQRTVAQKAGGGPLEDQPLILDTEQLIDDDGIGQVNVQWQAQSNAGRWVVIEGGNTQAFTPRQSEVGKPLRAKIEYLDGQGTLESIVTPATGPVQNVNDLPSGRPTLVGYAQEDETLQIDVSTMNDEDGLGPITYTWERSIDGIKWLPYSSNSSDPSLLRLTQAEVGYAYRGTIAYTDGFGAKESMATASSSAVQNLDDPATGTLIISGVFRKGQELSVDMSQIKDEDGVASINATWQVSSDGQNWSSAPDVNNRVLSLTKSHVSKVVRAKAVIVDNFGNQSTLYSSVSTPIENVNSKPRGTVRIMAAE
jgi:hypothetical protein